MALITIHGVQFRLPIVRLDGKDYFILGGSYQRLHHEKEVQERYTNAGEADRQVVSTDWLRWQMTLVIPFDSSYASASDGYGGMTFGGLDDLHTTMDKAYPHDGLQFYDISALENFGGTYTHYVYAKAEWETPHNNDPGIWQLPIELWGRVS